MGFKVLKQFQHTGTFYDVCRRFGTVLPSDVVIEVTKTMPLELVARALAPRWLGWLATSGPSCPVGSR